MEFFLKIMKGATKIFNDAIVYTSLGIGATYYLYNLAMWGWLASLNGLLIAAWPYIIMAALVLYTARLLTFAICKLLSAVWPSGEGSTSTVAA